MISKMLKKKLKRILWLFDEMNIEYMPEEYKGKVGPNPTNGTKQRMWTDAEIQWLDYLLSKNYTNKEIAISMGRSISSIKTKRKRLGKTKNTYNKKHIKEKIAVNKLFLNVVKPNSVLDLYCGENVVYDSYNVTKNDINKNINADYNKDALKLLCHLYSRGKQYDLIDLDPYGSAYDCFDLAIKMANKGICITLGEMGHKRWKRFDFVERHYGISNLSEFTSNNMIKHIQMIGIRNKKKLVVFSKKDWFQISRVWFLIKPYSISRDIRKY